MKPVHSLMLLLPLIASGVSLGCNAALADELSKNTNTTEILTPEQAKKLVDFGGQQLFISRPTTLRADSARVLAGFTGDGMVLPGLKTLDADSAKALAEFKGRQLFLSGLTEIDADTAQALAAFKGQQLFLPDLATLDADTAKALATIESWQGQLPRIIAFESPDSVAVAAALATRKGHLSFPNLEKISPQTLSALVQKEDVEIPLVDTLELIPEPYGSQLDDFVVPEDFLERESRKERRSRPR